MNEEIYDLKEKEKEQGQACTKQQWDYQHSGLLTGVVFVLAGALLLLSRFTNFELNNWWALFILIPAVSTLGHAWHVYQKRGRLGQEGGGALTGGLIMLFVASVFLFGISWGMAWPFILVIIGISTIVNSR
jgi:hypothetical protein